MASQHATRESRKLTKLSDRWLCVFENTIRVGSDFYPTSLRVRVKEKAIQPGPKIDPWLHAASAQNRGLPRCFIN